MDDRQPVSDAVFHILLSLIDEPRHGYGILQEVEDRTGGAVVLGSGTLYSAIKRIREAGWVEDADAPAHEDSRRRYYAITKDGKRVVMEEAHRLEALVRQARDKDVLPGGAR